MFDKPRKPVSLQLFEVLKKRKALSSEETYTYRRLSSGYQGEVIFADLLKKQLRNACIPIFSLNLKVNGSECQLDNILIFENSIFLLDIKNFQGDYLIENNQWYAAATKKERKNPLDQLKRGTIIFQEFLSSHYFHPSVDASLVFVNPGFHLYQAPIDIPIVFPSQLYRFIDQLNHIPSQLNNRHHTLAKQLMKAHLPKSKFEELPTYDYTQLKRGIVCPSCDGFMVRDGSRNVICNKCWRREPVDDAIFRHAAEFHLLFPNEPITVRGIDHWCNYTIPKSGIRRILTNSLDLVKYGKYSYYIFQK